MAEVDQDARARGYDIAHRAGTNPLMRELFAAAFGDALPAEVDPFSSCTWWTLGQAVAGLRMPPGGTLADLGCGRGGPGLWLARAVGAGLVGIDFSPAAVDIARGRAGDFLPAGRAEFRTGTFTATGLPDSGVDGLVSVDAVQFADDRLAALGEIRRVLRPGRRAVFTCAEVAEPDPEQPHVPTSWTEPVERAGFEVEARHVEPERTGRWLALYRLWLDNEDRLRREIGDVATDDLLAEARTGDRLARRIPLLFVIRRPDHD